MDISIIDFVIQYTCFKIQLKSHISSQIQGCSHANCDEEPYYLPEARGRYIMTVYYY